MAEQTMQISNAVPNSEIRAIRPEEKEECIALWCAVWPGDNDSYFRRYFEADVDWLPYYTQVAVMDGRLVSAAHICKRTVACGPFQLTMGGIANVATLPDYRGRGLNTACLRRAIEVMEGDAMDFSLLFTGINDYYARLGYTTLSAPRLRAVILPRRPAAPDGIVVREAAPQDLEEIHAIYDRFNMDRPIAVRRSPAYWRDWIGLKPERMDAGGAHLVAADEKGALLGYVAYQANFYQGHQIHEDYAYIVEFGAVQDDRAEAVAQALLSGVAERALAGGKRELHLSVPQEPSLMAGLRACCEEPTQHVTDAAMIRLLHHENLLASILMVLNERWIDAGRPSGAVSFKTPYGALRLDATGRFLKTTAEPALEPDNGAALPMEALPALLFGRAHPRGEVHNDATETLLNVLFPQQHGIYWSADGF